MLPLRRSFFAAIIFVFAASTQADEFILSYWCGPPPTEDADKRYAEVANCNFNYAMLPCSGASAAQAKAALDACRKHKLKYIVYDPRVGTDPSDPAFKTNLNAVVADYSKHPATGGYFLADEPAPDAFPRLAAANQYLLEKDPKHLPYINLYPNYVPEWAIGGTYEQYVEKYLTTVKPRLLCFDHYALLSNGTERPLYFENLEVIRRQAMKYNVPFGGFLLVTPHGGYRDPSEDEMRWQANTVLVYGAKALLHFTYWTPPAYDAFVFRNGIIDLDGKRTPHYEMARRINAVVKAWAPTLIKLQSTDVFHTGTLPAATRALPQDARVQVKDGGAFVLGMFKHADKSEWFMIVNRDMRQPATATLQFSHKTKRLKELSTNKGRLSSVKLRDGEFSVSLSPGGARLFRF